MITNCPRCKTKYVDTLEEIFCDSCAGIMAEDTSDEYQPQEEVYAEDIASEYDKETMLEALEEEWRQERLELQERQAYEDSVL